MCKGCGLKIDGSYVSTGEQSNYHPECCICSSCRQKISGSFLQSKDGSLRCLHCQPRCAGCQQPLSGEVIVVSGRQFHLNCFKCSSCSKVLDNGYYKANHAEDTYVCQECNAQAWKAEQDDANARAEALEKRVKARNSVDFRLAWRPQLSPCSRQTLTDLGVGRQALPPGGQICVCRDRSTGEVTVAAAPQSTPDASVNISYLAVALRVLSETGRAPMFSLDPKDPHDIGGELQVKMFYPSWLATTVYGEVLFQADYELKEISLGDRTFPFLPSSDEEKTDQGPSAARSWFVIRRAGVTIASDGALVPHVELGVDARQLVHGKKGFEDAVNTDPKDWFVRMAAAVSEHFMEVARQSPAVAELVHLARATVLARCLLEHGGRLDETALQRFRLPRCPEGDLYTMEIPTLRKKTRANSIVTSDGRCSLMTNLRSISGGVDLGLKADKVPTRAARQPLLDPNAGPRPHLPLFASAVRPSPARAA